MNNYLKISGTIILSTMTLSACFDKSNEDEIPLTEVPVSVTNVVDNIFPGISLTEAEKEVEDDAVIYKLEGKLSNGKVYEMKITESGEIIEIELDD